VHFTGAVEYRDLPPLHRTDGLCLIPLSPPQWVDIALPNKYFEYSACGKAILSTPIPDMLQMGGDHIAVYQDREEFVEKVNELALIREGAWQGWRSTAGRRKRRRLRRSLSG